MPELRTRSRARPAPRDLSRPWARLALRVLQKLVGALSLVVAGPATLLLILLMLLILRDWQGVSGGPPANGTFPLTATFAPLLLASASLWAAGFLTLRASGSWFLLSCGAWSFWFAIVSFVGVVYVREAYPVTLDPTVFILLVVLAVPAFPAIAGSLVARQIVRSLSAVSPSTDRNRPVTRSPGQSRAGR